MPKALLNMSPDTLEQACFTVHQAEIAEGGLTIHSMLGSKSQGWWLMLK